VRSPTAHSTGFEQALRLGRAALDALGLGEETKRGRR